MSKKKIKFFIVLYLAWSVLGFFADYQWLSMVPPWLVPLTAICSLYPPLLTIWYLLKYYQKPIPQWFTYWLIVGTAGYGLLAQFYFPLLMGWKGINFHDVGSMFWVAVYGCQAFFLFPYLREIRWYTVLPALIYIGAADLTHYFALTFVDFNLPGYPLWMKELTVTVALIVQFAVFLTVYLLARRQDLLQGRTAAEAVSTDS